MPSHTRLPNPHRWYKFFRHQQFRVETHASFECLFADILIGWLSPLLTWASMLALLRHTPPRPQAPYPFITYMFTLSSNDQTNKTAIFRSFAHHLMATSKHSHSFGTPSSAEAYIIFLLTMQKRTSPPSYSSVYSMLIAQWYVDVCNMQSAHFAQASPSCHYSRAHWVRLSQVPTTMRRSHTSFGSWDAIKHETNVVKNVAHV